ncbi:AprA-related methyltransferase, partial [Kineosporia babensis]
RSAFLYQDGVVLASTVRALDTLGLLHNPTSTTSFPGSGYLRVAWRALASSGWTEGTDTPSWTARGRFALQHRDRYRSLGEFLSGFTATDSEAWARPWDSGTQEAFSRQIDEHTRWRNTMPAGHLVVTHLDGALLVPALLSAQAQDKLRRPDGDTARLLTLVGWLDEQGAWSAQGRAGLDFVDHFGLVGSYLPMLAALEALGRGERVVSPGGHEWHCHRDLNVRASGAAHRRYFADADPLIQEAFAGPLRPRFIADMGCGDGSWLAHLHGLFGDSIRYIGVDASPVALERARVVLKEAGIEDPLLLTGDITDPGSLKELLAGHGLAIEQGLHIRSFIDHDRTFVGEPEPSGPSEAVPGWASGAYVGPDGRALSSTDVETDLVRHLRRWTPHVRDFGLVVLEAHCVAPALARQNLGRLHSPAFDTYHGLSHQYPVEHAAFLRCAALAGLQQTGHQERRYPSTGPFVAVSMNRFVVRGPALTTTRRPGLGQHQWVPAETLDRSDGEHLHRLLYFDGDLARPRGWAAGATAIVVNQVLAALEARTAVAQAGDVVRVLDYGAGTGFAALELLKSALEKGIPQLLAARGASFELHLVDIPSSWYARGYDLLAGFPWTRFHSLTDTHGRFRSLSEVLAGRQVDAAMANMVFHLLRPEPMGRAASALQEVLRPDGLLSWSAPDLGPAYPGSLLFHDPNRMLRGYWLNLLEGRGGWPGPVPAAVKRALELAAVTNQADRAAAQRRADRRILPSPQTVQAVSRSLEPGFEGVVQRRTFELLAEESLMTALVPANQREYLAEVQDPQVRTELVTHLLHERVFPQLRRGSAWTGPGLCIEWKLGRHVRRG